jgi:predicted nucleic acid-binding protein
VKRGIIVDTGPIVAFLSRRDQHHEWALAQLAEITPPLLTCEAVLSEACFLLGRAKTGARGVLELVQRNLISPIFRLEEEVAPITKLMERYANVPMSLADACLVRMTEQRSGSAVLTLDSDFRTYRRHGRQAIPLIAPPR